MIGQEGAIQGAPTTLVPDRVFTGHQVALSVFEGPLDLLIYLIQANEIDVFTVAVEHITSQYRAYLADLDSRDIEVIGEFLVMVAQLMEIKSSMLLPREARPEEDQEEVGDPRAALLARLLEYRRFKTVADHLRERAERQRWVFSRGLINDGNGNGRAEHSYLMLNDASPFDLWAAFQNVLNRLRERPAAGEVVRPRFTIPQRMAAIAAQVRWAKDGLRFADLFEGDATVMELIVTFLALLELIRQRRIRVMQNGLFDEIWVYQWGSPEAA